MARLDNQALDGLTSVQQKVSAKDDATVIVAGRDVITGNVFVGKFARLRDVWLDPAPVFDEADTDRFVGREWLAESVDRFLASRDRGYLVVQAAAGLGKTAFAAWLAQSRGWACHFTRRRKGRSATTALRNLAAQLIARYELGEQFAPGGLLPATAGEPAWFDQVVRAAASSAGDGRLVLVVDGLDEAEHVDGDLPLGLPALLPKGVYAVVTCRTGTDLSALRQPWQAVSIEADSALNVADLRRFLAKAAAEEPLAAVLADRGLSASAFAGQLIDRCGGVWVYLRYVLDELRFGLRDVSDLGGLPVDLASYYLESFTSSTSDHTWSTVCLPLLATLCAIPEPVPVSLLARLAGLPDPAPVRELCDGRLRPFLTITTDDRDGRRYGIYHSSLREFISGAESQHTLDRTRSRADELAHATVAAHARIALHYLDAFGGLTEQLPALGADPLLANVDSGYPRRYLAYHLDKAHQFDNLHQLLACEHSARNLWFDVHDRAGTIGDYLADLRRARRHAEHASTAGLEIRYAVMIAAITSLTANVPASLLERLLAAGMWPAARALNHARNLHNPLNRAQALTAVAPHLDADTRATVLEEALAATRAVVDNYWRTTMLHTVARLSDVHRLDALAEALAVIAANPDERERIDSYLELIPDLPERLLPAVLTAIGVVTDSFGRARLLTELAPRLPDGHLDAALAVARDLPDNDDRAWALGRLADQLPEPQRGHVLDEALTAAEATADPADRAWAVSSVIPYLSRRQGERLRTDLLTAIPAMPDPLDRVWAYNYLADGLLPAAHVRLTAEALAVARSIADEGDRVRALRVAATLVPEAERDDVVSEALRVAECIVDSSARTSALTALAVDLDSPLRDRPVAASLDSARLITDEEDRVRALSDLIPHLPDHLLADALDAVAEITHQYDRSWLLGHLVPKLPTQLLGAALTATQTITDDQGRARVLGELAMRLPDGQREDVATQALDAARAVSDPYYRTRVFSDLAALLPAPQRDDILAEALTAARSDTRKYRAITLARLLPHLPQALREQATSDALASLDGAGEVQQIFATNKLAPLVPQPTRDHILATALAEARRITPDYYGPLLVAMLSHHMPESRRDQLLNETIAAIQALPNRSDPVTVVLQKIARYARYLPTGVLTTLLTAVQVAVDVINEAGPSDAVGEFSDHLQRVPKMILAEALTAATHLPSEINPTAAIGAIALYLPEPMREQAITAALTPARHTMIARRILLRQADLLWTDQTGESGFELVRRCLDALNLDECLNVLAAAVPIVHRVAGDEAITACLHTVHLVQRWWGTSDA